MVTKEIKIDCVSRENERWGPYLVQTAFGYESTIKLKYKNAELNAKSLIGMMSLGITNGSVVTIIADGNDEQEAAEAIEKLLRGM